MRIPFIIEPDYGSYPVWTPAIRAGIDSELSRKKYDSVYIDPKELDSGFSFDEDQKLAVLIGTSPSLVPGIIEKLGKMGVGVLLVTYQPPENAKVRGVVRTDYVDGIDRLVAHLFACGCGRPALYASSPDSSSDMVKRRAYLENAAAAGFEPLIIENRRGLSACFDELSKRLHKIDSIVCTNDIAAVSALSKLERLGIRVPDDIQIVSFGGSELSKLCHPPLTVIEMANFTLGRQVVSSYAYLSRASEGVTLSVRVAGDLIIGGSTKEISSEIPEKKPLRSKSQSFYDDEEVRSFGKLEKLLSLCDKTDRDMIGMILSGTATEAIAESLALSPESVRYRLRRVITGMDFASRSELLAFIRENGFESIFVNKM